MSRIRLQNIVALIISATVFLATALPAHALEACNSPHPSISPLPLLDTTPQATFTINVGDNTGNSQCGHTGQPTCWYMETQCSTLNAGLVSGSYQNVPATANGDGTTISAYIRNNSGFGQTIEGVGCEFNPINNPIQVVVKELANGQQVSFCQADYNVTDVATQCKLALTPTDNITPDSILTASGSNLLSGRGYTLFFDNDVVGLADNVLGRNLLTQGHAPHVSTPTFTEAVPPKLLTPGMHYISLRQLNSSFFNILKNSLSIPEILDLTKPVANFFGPPLCPLPFSVGTPNNPGSVGNPGSTVYNVCKAGHCSSGGGKECTDNKNNPGISTAIGCIHTDPVGLAKDLLTFVIGISGGLAFLMMLLGAFQMLTSAGNPETLNAGRERLTNAVIGLLFVIFAMLFLQIIGAGILAIPGFG